MRKGIRLSVRTFGVLVASAALVAGMMTLAPAAASAGTTGTISGTVSYDGSSVPGVCVDAFPSGGGTISSVTTASDGTYTISSLAAGTYLVEFDPTCANSVATSYASLTRGSVLVTASTVTTENASLSLGGSITGTVNYDGSGVSGVCVYTFPEAGTDGINYPTTTGSGGTYTIVGLAAGSYEVEVDPTCSGGQSSTFASQYLTSVVVAAGATTTEDVTLSLGGSITGTVSYNGTGVGGVCVYAFPSSGGRFESSATTRSDGSYTIDNVTGSYDVRFDPTCGGTVSSPYAIQEVNSVSVTDGSTTSGEDASLSLGGSITGTVSYDGTGVSGVCVEANSDNGGPSSGEITTASDGTYSLSNLAAGAYSVDVDTTCNGTVSSPYASQTLSSVSVTAGASTTRNASLALGGSITGTVSYNGTGVGGVCVDVYSSTGSGSTTTASDGTYTVTGLAAGTYEVEVEPNCGSTTSSPYATQTLTSVSVTAGSTTSGEDASLSLGGSITGTVSYNGTGVGGVCVYAFPSGGGTASPATTASDGTYTVTGLAAGSYEVEVDTTCSQTVSSTYATQDFPSVSVTAGASTTQNASLALGGSITGTVSYDGTGVGDVCLTASLSDGNSEIVLPVTTGSDGTYTISGLAAGTYDVDVYFTCNGGMPSTYAGQYLTSVVVTAGEMTTENVSLSLGGSISGTVSYDGSGVPGVCVDAFSDESSAAATTGSDGTYTISDLAAGSYEVEVDTTCSGTISSTYAGQILNSVSVTAGSTTSGEDVSLALGGSITGTVSYNGTGVGGVCVDVYSSTGSGSTTTASDGTYTVTGLAAGTYEVDVDPTCGGTVSTTYATQDFPSVSVTAGASTTQNASLALGGSITGTVSYNGTGVSGVCVDAYPSVGGTTSSATTASDGTYIISDLAPGSYEVEVDPTCYQTVSSAYESQTLTSVSVAANTTTTANVSLTLTPTDDYSFAGGGGTGTAPASGSGLDGATITLPANTFSYAGYTFAGWSDGANTYAAGTTYTLSSDGAAIILTAQWTGNAGGGGGGGGGGGSAPSGPSAAPAPSQLPTSDYGTPVSSSTSSTASTTLTTTSGGASSSVDVPAGALPSGTTVSVYPVTTSSLSSEVPSGDTYVAAFAVSWQTPGGTSPDATSPITMTITDPSIVAGDEVYVLTSSGLTEVGAATSNGTITFTFSNDPVFVLTSSHAAQAPLALTTLRGRVGTPVALATSGGSGTGAVTFTATNGTAKGCAIRDGKLTATSAGTCLVVATKASNSTYAPASTAATVVTLVMPVRPATVTATFAGSSRTLTARDRTSLIELAKKLVTGATVVVTGYAKGNTTLARARAVAVRSFLSKHAKVHVTLKIITTTSNRATVVTTAQ